MQFRLNPGWQLGYGCKTLDGEDAIMAVALVPPSNGEEEIEIGEEE
jgi:hypothetical protein